MRRRDHGARRRSSRRRRRGFAPPGRLDYAIRHSSSAEACPECVHENRFRRRRRQTCRDHGARRAGVRRRREFAVGRGARCAAVGRPEARRDGEPVPGSDGADRQHTGADRQCGRGGVGGGRRPARRRRRARRRERRRPCVQRRQGQRRREAAGAGAGRARRRAGGRRVRDQAGRLPVRQVPHDREGREEALGEARLDRRRRQEGGRRRLQEPLRAGRRHLLRPRPGLRTGQHPLSGGIRAARCASSPSTASRSRFWARRR